MNLPVVLAQSPLVQHMQFAAQNSPVANQAFLSQLVLQKQEKEKEKVPKTEKSEGIRTKTDTEDEPRGASARGREGKDSHKEPEQKPWIPEEAEHLVDIKV
ncbi:MAG: hypothetical protein ACOCV7_03305 [Desulfonatronovibrionaceae bacterium]